MLKNSMHPVLPLQDGKFYVESGVNDCEAGKAKPEVDLCIINQ